MAFFSIDAYTDLIVREGEVEGEHKISYVIARALLFFARSNLLIPVDCFVGKSALLATTSNSKQQNIQRRGEHQQRAESKYP